MTDFDVWHSKPLDVHIWSEHPEINEIVDAVYNSFNEEQLKSIKGQSKNLGKANGKVHLKIILIDLYVAWKTDPSLSIGVALGNDAYKVKSRYNALHVSPKVRKVITCLEQQEYIDFRKGSFNRQDSGKGNRVSRIKATERLAKLFSKLTLETYELNLNHKKECIVLKDHDVDIYGVPILAKGKKRTTEIEYEDTPQTIQMRSELNTYNKFLAETYVDIPSLAEPTITRVKRNGDKQVIPIGQTNKFVRRIFSRGSWELNGRFYGGWWQQIDKTYRKQIAINDYPTVEVDYKGLHVAILSAQKGIQDDPQDRYDLGRQILPQFDVKEQRSIVKQLVLTAINAESEQTAYSAFRNDQPTKSPQKNLTNTELSLLLNTFTDKHPHLRDDLCSDKGIRLMWIDSQITAQVLKISSDLKVPILSVHDSYIISIFDVPLLLEIMSEATKKVVGLPLSVEQELPSYDDIVEMKAPDRVVGRDTFIDLFLETAEPKNKTPEYQERLKRFINYRESNFKETYWLLPPSNHY